MSGPVGLRKRGGTCSCQTGKPEGFPRRFWPGPSPRPCGARAAYPPGAKAPGQRPPRPRRSLRPRRVGRWPAIVPDLPVCGAASRAGGGNAGRVSCSRPEGRKQFHRVNGRGHRPCRSATLILDQPGAKAPCQRPPRPWRALCTRQVGRWPAIFPDLPVHRAPSRSGGETRVAFPGPARTDESTVTASMARAIAPATAPRCPLSSREPKPPASARPAHGGRFAPAGSGAGLCWCGLHLSSWQRPAWAGETRVAFPDPARTDESTVTAAMAGAIAPATTLRWDQDQPGAQSPRPAPAPPLAGASRPPGRALASVCPGPAGLQGTVARGRGKRGSRFLFPPGQAKGPSTLQWQGPSPLPQRPAAP